MSAAARKPNSSGQPSQRPAPVRRGSAGQEKGKTVSEPYTSDGDPEEPGLTGDAPKHAGPKGQASMTASPANRGSLAQQNGKPGLEKGKKGPATPTPAPVQPAVALGKPVQGGPKGPVAGRQLIPVVMPVPYIKPKVERIPGCPDGLEYLCVVDQLLVHQQLQLFELALAYEQQNKYVVKNTMGQFIFRIEEESDLLQRCCCGKIRAFEMKVLDYRDVELLHFIRPLRAPCTICFCCLQEMQVYGPPGTLLGSIKMQCNPIFPTFLVLDSKQVEVVKIKGPFITSACCNDVVFDIFPKNGATRLGFISKNWTGAFREFFTDVDNFTLVFPMDLDVKVKAVLLGAVMLIDFMFFETGGGSRLVPDAPGALLG